MDTMMSTWNLGGLVADSNHISILSTEKHVGEWYRYVVALTIVLRIDADSGVFSYTNLDALRQTNRRLPIQHLDIRACPREHILCKVPVAYPREELYHSSPTHFPKYDR
jgi:hypothetical protein